MNLVELIERFPDDESCRQHLIAIRWPDGVKCPRCECDRVSELPKRKQWTCLGCRYRFSATAGTIFHKSHIGLRKWFMAIFIVLNAKKAMSSLELNRLMKISQECCWHLLHRIREAMREDDKADIFWGVVQADEYYHGGQPRPEDTGKIRRGRGSKNKQPIIGVVESATGKIKTAHVEKANRKTIVKMFSQWLDMPNTSLHTDEYLGYRYVGTLCHEHRKVNHQDWYVAKDGTHCNAVENAWSLFARAVMGSYHHISRKHLQRYLDEFDSRFNARKDDSTDFFNRILKQANGRHLPHRHLVG